MKLFGAGSDSGTFDYFTEAVVGKAKASRGDYTASEDDNTLVQGIANDKQALGYIPYAYYEPNKKRLKAVAVDGGHGPVLPSRETVENGAYQPLSRPMFIYVNAKSASKPEVKRFVEFYVARRRPWFPKSSMCPCHERRMNLRSIILRTESWVRISRCLDHRFEDRRPPATGSQAVEGQDMNAEAVLKKVGNVAAVFASSRAREGKGYRVALAVRRIDLRGNHCGYCRHTGV